MAEKRREDVSGWPPRTTDRRKPVRPFGRRSSDLDSEQVVTRKLVIATVVLVDALYLAGDALLFGQNCP